MFSQYQRGGSIVYPHTDNIQKPAKSPDCLLGEVKQPSNSRLNETRAVMMRYFRKRLAEMELSLLRKRKIL